MRRQSRSLLNPKNLLWLGRCIVSPRGYAEVNLLNGKYRMQVPHQLRGNSRLCYLYQDQYDPSIAILPYLIFPGMRVIDVGAHYGIYSIILSQLCGSTGGVIAYEPVPEHCRYLYRNVVLYKLPNIQVKQAALSDIDGFGVIQINKDRSRTSIRTDINENTPPSTILRLSSLDNTLKVTPKISFVKIDTEGFDGKVIRGMSQLMKRDHPIVQFEINDSGLKEEIMQLLLEVDYQFLSISDLCDLKNIPKAKNLKDCNNYYGLPPSYIA